MLGAALDYAARGIPVFPIRQNKAPFTRRCFKDATCDEATLREWWGVWPDAGIGIPTGEASGLYVVDIDLKTGGDVSLVELCERHGFNWPETLTVLTGSGGFHYHFRYPQGLDLRNTSGNLGPGIDTRPNGGFVVAPPSLHASGNRYEWVNDVEPAPLPDLLIKLLTEEKPAAAALPGTKTLPQGRGGAGIGLVITEGGRNDALFKIGCSLRGKAAELSETEAELSDINARRCSPPLPEPEVLKIARSAASYAANRMAVGV